MCAVERLEMEMGNLVERITHLQQQNSESQEAYIEQQARMEALCEELKVGLLRVRVCACVCCGGHSDDTNPASRYQRPKIFVFFRDRASVFF